ncbi:phosphatidylserine decarboxylase [Lysinibacillus sp. MHQ-1]|nr:phosphatidylserine decarboxylase [Lysinibacillus sp. MHQ-1]
MFFYLSPADYHRIHSPIDGEVLRQYTLGQKSYPVNQIGLTYGKKPISHNYRLVTELKTAHNQQVAFIKVGGDLRKFNSAHKQDNKLV